MDKELLFRPEAVEEKKPSLFGGAVISTGASMRGVSILTVFLMTVLMLTLVFGTYERRERVSGYVAPVGGLVRVNPPRTGVVMSIEVIDGQEVYAGQSLFSISTLRGTTGGSDADMAQVKLLERDQANIKELSESEILLSNKHVQDVRRRIIELEVRSERIKGQQQLARERIELVNRELGRLESLQQRGHVSASHLDARQGDLLAALTSESEYGRELQGLQAEIAALESELQMIPLRLGARQGELQGRLLEIERMITEAEVQRETVVRAPISGRVTSLIAFPGQSVTPNQSVLAILPDDSQLQAVLLVPSHAAGFIQPGQHVRLRFDAFPHQRFGVHGGLVYSVSRTMLNPGDQVGPLLLQTPAYRVVARLDADSIMAYGEAIPLTPDLTLQADVIRDRMRIIEWIFDPVRAAVSAL